LLNRSEKFGFLRSTWKDGVHQVESVLMLIGPLPVVADLKYSAQYMEAIFTPGMTAPAHRHAGPEAWYTLTGETCLETSEGYYGRDEPGGPAVIVRGGLPMHLTAIGKETRRSLVLILHDSNSAAHHPGE
jgi:quercetin dioxygenase-like cupin family protein